RNRNVKNGGNPSMAPASMSERRFCLRPQTSLYHLLRGTAVQVRVALRGVILKRANSPPRITARRGGGVTKKWREASWSMPLGWCSLSHRPEHHPALAKADATRYFLDRSATPPRGDARRGIRSHERPNLDSWATCQVQ